MIHDKIETQMRIGIFDSGIGGEAVADALRRLLPTAKIITANDHNNVPYGDKKPEDIIRLTRHAIQPLLSASCDVIVIACNTATTVAISSLRIAYPSQHFVGIEPMIKPAAVVTKTGHIAVCATPRTLESNRYKELKKEWANNIIVTEPNCKNWASQIEQGKSDQIEVEAMIKSLVKEKVDVIVLGCTHFHWLKQRMIKAAPNITIMEPSDSIVLRIKDLLETRAY